MPRYFQYRHLKRCHVCGDVALSFNFSGISCESCRYFFRRYAQKHSELRCQNDERCEINIESRRHCKRCRMNKCLLIGMKIEMVGNKSGYHYHKSAHNDRPSPRLGPAENADLDDHDESSQVSVMFSAQQSPEEQSSGPARDVQQLFGIGGETYCLQMLANLALVFRTYSPRIVGYAHTPDQVFNMQEHLIRAIVSFGNSIGGFRWLDPHDQLLVIKSAFPEILMLRSLFYYVNEKDSFIMRMDEAAEEAVYVPLPLFYRAGNLAHLMRLHRQLAKVVHTQKDDALMRDLMTVLLLFKPKKPRLKYPDALQYEFARYRYLLERYLRLKLRDDGRAASLLATLLRVIDECRVLKESLFEIYHHINACPVSHSLLEIYEDSE